MPNSTNAEYRQTEGEMFKAIVQHLCPVKNRWDNKEKRTDSQALTGSQKGSIFLVTWIHVFFSFKEYLLEMVCRDDQDTGALE